MGIYDDNNKIQGSWMKWRRVNDCIAGTLIEKREGKSPQGDDQMIYEIKLSDDDVIIDGEKQQVSKGDIMLLGGRPFIDNQLKNVRVGQIIGLKFYEERDSKTKNFSPTKCIQVYAKEGLLDNEWLEMQSPGMDTDLPAVPQESGTQDSAMAEFDRELDAAAAGDTRNKIIRLAREKLGAGEDIEDVKIKVMEKTNKAFIDQNLDAILAELQSI